MEENQQHNAERVTYLAIPYEDRNAAKKAAGKLPDGSNALGFDQDKKLWFAKPGADLAPLAAWVPKESGRADGAPNAQAEFGEVLDTAGFKLPDGVPQMDGKWHRVQTKDDKPGQYSGAYRGFLDGRPAGLYQDHREHSKPQKWVATGQRLTPEERATMVAEAENKRMVRQAAREATYAHHSRRVRQAYGLMPAVTNNHPYLERKGVKAHDHLRVDKKGRLVVPIHNETGRIRTVQRISEDGTKRLKKGAEKAGNFFVVNGPIKNGEPVLYGEGYSTAATIAEATERPVVMTVDAGNMPTVARKLAAKYPASPHVFLADDDRENKENKGLMKAQEAAKVVRGVATAPQFADPNAKGSDFNDLKDAEGIEAVRSQVNQAIEKVTERNAMEEHSEGKSTGPVVTEKFDQTVSEGLGASETDDQANLIEKDAQRRKEAGQEAEEEDPFGEGPAAEEAAEGPAGNTVPESVKRRFVEVNGKFYYANNPSAVGFVDRGERLQTKQTNRQATESMVDVAEARGWTTVKVRGTHEFRREAWLEAASRGMEVNGFKPKEEDLAALKQRTEERKTNEVEDGRERKRDAADRDEQTDKPENTTTEKESAEDKEAEGKEDKPTEEPRERGTAAYEHEVTDEYGNRHTEEVTAPRSERDVKADLIRDKERDPASVARENPELVNEIAAMKIAEKIGQRFEHGQDRERFESQIREGLAQRVEQGQPTDLKVQETVATRDKPKEKVKEKEDER